MTPIEENAWLAWSGEVNGRLRELKERVERGERMRREIWKLLMRLATLTARLSGVPEGDIAVEQAEFSRLMDLLAPPPGLEKM
jgi:hypothetical protein